MAKLFDPPRYIALEGPIRVGKSTLSGIIADRLHAQRVVEPEDNPFLAAFYDGEPGAGFQAQFAFLMARFDQLRGLERSPHKAIVCDYIFEKDKLFACINLNDAELAVYNRYYNYFREQLKQDTRYTFNQKFRAGEVMRRLPLNVADYARVPLLNPNQLVTSWRESLPPLTSSSVASWPRGQFRAFASITAMAC